MMDGQSPVRTMDGVNVMLDCAALCVCMGLVFSRSASVLRSLRQLVVYDYIHFLHHYSSVLYNTNYDLLHHELSHAWDVSHGFDSVTSILLIDP